MIFNWNYASFLLNTLILYSKTIQTLFANFDQMKSLSNRPVGVSVKLILLVILWVFVDTWAPRKRCLLASDSLSCQSRTGGGGNWSSIWYLVGWVFLFGSTEQVKLDCQWNQNLAGRSCVCNIIRSARTFEKLSFPKPIYLSRAREVKIKFSFGNNLNINSLTSLFCFYNLNNKMSK